MNIVFFGTPEYTLPVLTEVHKNFKTKAGISPIVAVVTKRPKRVGKKDYLKYSAVDTWAYKRDIPIYFDAQKLINDRPEVDVGVLAAYGEILPKEVINSFPYGILNIHPSLLPRWRGPAPVQATLIAGDKKAGATIIKIDEKMDHGPIVSQFDEEIEKDETTGMLRDRLFKRSAKVMAALLPPYLEGKVNLRKQNHDKATYTELIRKDDAFINPEALAAALEGKNLDKEWDIPFMKDFTINYSPTTIHRFIRAMKPWPVAWSKINISNQKLRIKILKAHIETNTKQKLVLDEVQLEGKNPVSWEQFEEGYPEASFKKAS